MTVSLLPFLACLAMIVTGVTLLLERSLVRVLTGVIVLGNGVNLLIITSGGRAGGPPLLDATPESEIADPLPQALVLTAIVITLGVTAFVLAMVHRSWQLTGSDEVQDDTEDRHVRLRAAAGELSGSLRRRREDYRRLVAEQRAELAELDAEQAHREHREQADLERRIREVNAELGQWMQEHKSDDLPPEQLRRRFEEARRQEMDTARENVARVQRLREEHARRRREQLAQERRLRKRLRMRQRLARKELRAAIRQERERQALAQDPELEEE
ncbi:Na(+)/H(+) antiporter subunit C [Nonomuraea sp. NN258]|uniref:Na(+)/H(+) antiporter subunit C n=1 Tax=Nonomuraea antri TaxID=2730852 RepID=UPI001569D90B|nr:Na(+)/H(+) antiporter subunit C [Nonomuraea antri]NRQ36655.1 Na(+)/H(+) antiporter subunit C [Nonomuraea antri]